MIRLSASAPSEVPAALVDEGQSFAISMLEQYGELLPFAFTAVQGAKPGLFSAYHDQPATGAELLGLLYGGLKTSAAKDEFDSVAVFSEGTFGNGDALVCFVENSAGQRALIVAPFRYERRPLRVLGVQVRRGRLVLDAPQATPTGRRIFLS